MTPPLALVLALTAVMKSNITLKRNIVDFLFLFFSANIFIFHGGISNTKLLNNRPTYYDSTTKGKERILENHESNLYYGR